MTRTIKKIAAILTSFLVVAPIAVRAAVTYTPLEPQAFGNIPENGSNLGAFLGAVFNWGIAAAIALALIMIILGGMQLMTTDSWTGKEEGKSRIFNAIWGLGLALVSWLLLYIINPNLVTFQGNLLLNPTK